MELVLSQKNMTQGYSVPLPPTYARSLLLKIPHDPCSKSSHTGYLTPPTLSLVSLCLRLRECFLSICFGRVLSSSPGKPRASTYGWNWWTLSVIPTGIQPPKSYIDSLICIHAPGSWYPHYNVNSLLAGNLESVFGTG